MATSATHLVLPENNAGNLIYDDANIWIQISDGLTWPAHVAILNCFFKIKNAFNFPILFCTTKTAVAEFVLQQNA